MGRGQPLRVGHAIGGEASPQVLRLYPHTEQLPRLLRAIDLEFPDPLPKRVVRVDHRGDGYHKILLRIATIMFCDGVNVARSDDLRLLPLLTPDLVAKVAIAQKITEETRRGACHRFKLYAGSDFFVEVRISGKRLVFADHVLQRFSARVPNNPGEDWSLFLLAIYSAQKLISMPIGSGRAFVVQYDNSILAFPYKESDTEFFVLTCLTVNEMSGLEVEVPPRAYNLHYGTDFKKPTLRNWSPIKKAEENKNVWDAKISLAAADAEMDGWQKVGQYVTNAVLGLGFGPGSQIYFQDGIWGPSAIQLKPGKTETWLDELADLRREEPGVDWDAVLTRQQVEDENFIRSCVIE